MRARGRIPWDDGWAAVAAAQEMITAVETKSAFEFARIFRVARVALLDEDGADARLEKVAIFLVAARGLAGEANEQGQGRSRHRRSPFMEMVLSKILPRGSATARYERHRTRCSTLSWLWMFKAR